MRETFLSFLSSLCVCCFWCSLEPLLSLATKKKVNKRESGLSFECYLLALVYSKHGYKDFCSRGCICISCPYISANENARVRVKLSRRHIATIHSLLFFFFPNLLWCFNSLFISVWFFPTLHEHCCQLFSWLCSMCVPFSWKSQVAAVCITTRKCWICIRNKIWSFWL